MRHRWRMLSACVLAEDEDEAPVADVERVRFEVPGEVAESFLAADVAAAGGTAGVAAACAAAAGAFLGGRAPGAGSETSGVLGFDGVAGIGWAAEVVACRVAERFLAADVAAAAVTAGVAAAFAAAATVFLVGRAPGAGIETSGVFGFGGAAGIGGWAADLAADLGAAGMSAAWEAAPIPDFERVRFWEPDNVAERFWAADVAAAGVTAGVTAAFATAAAASVSSPGAGDEARAASALLFLEAATTWAAEIIGVADVAATGVTATAGVAAAWAVAVFLWGRAPDTAEALSTLLRDEL